MNISTQDVHFYIWPFPNVSDMAFSHFQKIIIWERIGFWEVAHLYHEPLIKLKLQYKFDILFLLIFSVMARNDFASDTANFETMILPCHT